MPILGGTSPRNVQGATCMHYSKEVVINTNPFVVNENQVFPSIPSDRVEK